MPPQAAPLVLVVDDDAPIRDIVARNMRRDGFRVIEAGSGEEALAVAAAAGEPLSLAVCDVVMPGMDGGELATRLRERQPGLPVLFVSGLYEEAPTPCGRGPTAFMAKPFRGDLFGRAVRALLGVAAPTPARPARVSGSPSRPAHQ